MNKNETYRYPVALTIAGSDSGGGAGIQADIKTFSSLGVFGASAITAVTAQNTQGVRGIQAISPDILRGQIEAVLADFTVDALKIGMLHNKDAVKVVSESLPSFRRTPIILDPVMISTSGSKLLEDDAIRVIIDELFPKATLLTPNIPETEYLSGIKIKNEADLLLAARELREKGCNAILVKGGHIPGAETVDRLFIGEAAPVCLVSPTVETSNTHGTGCTLSSAIAAYMALGHPLTGAVRLAKEYINNALIHGANVCMGKGSGPVNHFFSPAVLHKIRCHHE
ncbi:bifunctional hydroxymethylpyrimidine kinase/phosphomethylpyrimidine kinase [Parabacteroides sp. ZJ-118]|uniref:bifunctional hydroxymethylpyrimidine kinase/phosphomethylpyrimidine kinase n=1 Tax=Parabacteroides sp. ZJ-118 TaxID=2709398 RepID=UPI0013EBD6A3|nr:bifunctional hydroxymethylpyrimidine kinase/phosphomethylpyrimidine kinase [Parabacteroides sp. ZJ-118]